jgi:hypothetical protein
MELELRDNRAIKEFTAALHESFPHDIEKLEVIPVFEHIIYKGFPVSA